MTHTWQYNHPFFLKKSADPTYQSLISFPNPLSLSPPSPHISLYHRAAEEKSRMATGGGGDGGSSGTVDRKPRMATRQRQCLIYYGGSRHSWMPRMATQGRFSPSQPLPPLLSLLFLPINRFVRRGGGARVAGGGERWRLLLLHSRLMSLSLSSPSPQPRPTAPY